MKKIQDFGVMKVGRSRRVASDGCVRGSGFPTDAWRLELVQRVGTDGRKKTTDDSIEVRANEKNVSVRITVSCGAEEERKW